MYTMGEFRKNLRKAFNDADEGHQVTIHRYGQSYQLVSLVSLPLGGSSFESSATDLKPIHPLTPKFIPKLEVNPKSHTYIEEPTLVPEEDLRTSLQR